jgi:stearoyl-CoA desaturase (delta-9 desaturase)
VSHLWLVPLVALTLAQIAVIATSVYLHRALAHRALRLHPALDLGFRVVLWLTTGQSRREWVAVHRKHHAFTDRDGDPHSPRLLGLWRVQLANVYYYIREARNPETLRVFAPDIAEDRWDRALFSRGLLGVGLGTALLCLGLGPGPGLIAAASHAVLYVFVLAPLINGLGHWRGAQTFANTAYNWPSLAWVTGGESLHNNHHAHPRAPKFSMRRFEFDPSWVVIAGLAAVGLATIVGRSSRRPGETDLAWDDPPAETGGRASHESQAREACRGRHRAVSRGVGGRPHGVDDRVQDRTDPGLEARHPSRLLPDPGGPAR